MHLRALAALLLQVVLCLGQSGDSADPSDDEDQRLKVQMNFTCFSKLRLKTSNLLCVITERPSEDADEIYFQLCTEKCENRTELQPFKAENLFRKYYVCMFWGDNKICRDHDVRYIVKLDRPTNLTIKYNNESAEYEFHVEVQYEAGEYLFDKYVHELVLRKTGEEWPDCENQAFKGPKKRCFNNFNIRIPKRDLPNATKFEARVRSKPNGVYYHGSWSDWSETFSFSTEGEQDDLFLVIVISLVVLAILLFIIILIKYFWKSRIKPVIWPEIPDHKVALDKICKKPKQITQLSFNPDYFDSMAINKVDYIKAMVRTEDSFQIDPVETHMEKPLDNTLAHNELISRAVDSHGWTSNGSDMGRWTHPNDHSGFTEIDGDNSEDLPKNPENVSLLHSPCNQKCNMSDNGINGIMTPDVGILDHFPIYSNTLKQPEGINFYITMSAFKTPTTAINQSLNV